MKILERRNRQINEIPQFLKSLPQTVCNQKYNQDVNNQDYHQLMDYMDRLKATKIEDTKRIEEQVAEIDRLYRRLRLIGFNIRHDKETRTDRCAADGEFPEEPLKKQPQILVDMENIQIDDHDE